MRARRAVRADRRRPAVRRADGCAARAVEPDDLVKIGPAAERSRRSLRVPPRLPGRRARPGLRLRALGTAAQRRAARRRCTPTSPPTPAHPGQLALQYWFFYVFNDFNNLHEGDWEMIQLVFDAGDAREALAEDPVLGRLQLARRRRARRLGRRQARARRRRRTRSSIRPPARTPTSSRRPCTSAARPRPASAATTPAARTSSSARRSRRSRATPTRLGRAFPWIAFEGRWGELQKAFFNGPTGPNLKPQWTEPIEWSEGWRDRSYAVPTGGVFGTGATDFFCSAVETGSKGLVQLLRNPGLTLLVLGALLALVLFASRARPGARRAAPPRAPARVGSDPLRRRPDVHQARTALPRDRPPLHPAGLSSSRRCRRSSSAGSACSASTPPERPPARWCCSWSRSARR